MARVHYIMDGQPGTLPDIRMDANDIVFTMVPPGTPRGDRLTIRCDAAGELWIAIQTDHLLSENDLPSSEKW